MTTPPMVTIWPSYTNLWPSYTNLWPSYTNLWPSYTNQEDAMTTPTPDAVPSEEFRIKRLREWAHRALLRQPGASIIERTVAEDMTHLEAKYQRDLTAAQLELASVKAENSKLRSALEIVHFKREPWQ